MRSKPALVSLALILLTSIAFAQDTHQIRIVRPVDNRSVTRLQGSLSPRARMELDRGPVPATMTMQQVTMVFSRTAAQQADLDKLLAEQQDRSSPNYHKWLTPEEYGDRFGLVAQDVYLIAAWLHSQGFTIDEIARSRTWISFSGIAAQFDAAFHTSIHNYVVDGKTHYAPSAVPSIPDAFAGVVAAVSGLHDFRPQPKSHARRVSPRLTSSLSGNHFVAPGDFGTIYNLPDYTNGVFQPGNDGSGQTIGIVGQTTSQSGVTSSAFASDNDTFRSVSKLPAGSLTLTPVGSPTTFSSGEAEEAALDIQWSGAVAPNASIIFAYSPNALITSLQYLVNQNQASVISISYGECETQVSSTDITTIEGYLQQANAQGQTVVAAAGDVGAADCDGTSQAPVAAATHGLAVDYPASSAYVTAMGGTGFTGDSTATVSNGTAAAQQYWNSSSDPNDTSASAFSYIPEAVWNDTLSSGTNVGTGGGMSVLFGKPSWQSGNGVPPDGHRDVPDLALASSPSHDGYIICSQGSCQTGYRRNSDQTFTVIGGTSAAVPNFAGIAALANQKLGTRLGNPNPQLYSLAANSPWAFNDITAGDNKVVCTVGTPDCTSSPIGYSAGPGYDQATGLGSVDATALINALNNTPNPHFLVLPNSRYETFPDSSNVNVGVTVTPKEGFSGTVGLTCTPSPSLAGVTCSIDVPSVTTPGSAILLINGPGSGQGQRTGTVTVAGISGSMTNSVAINVTITAPDFSLASGNSSETVSTGGSTTDTITLTSLQGFAGNVAISCTGTTGLTCSLGSALVTLSSNSSATDALTVNAATSATTGSVTISANNSEFTHTLQIPVTVNSVPPDFTLTVANPVVSISSGGIITTNLTVTPAGGFNSDVALTCSVPSSLGTTTCSISPSTVTGGNGTALVTVNGAVLTMDRGAPFPFRHRGLGAYAPFVFALGMVFTVKPKRSLRRNLRAWRNSLFGLLLLCIMFGALSCGGGSGGGSTGTGPTPLNGNVTITGTGGGTTHTATINVTVR